MIISLQHTQTKQKLVNGFYIPSSNPEAWLIAFEHHNISLQEVSCYETPVSIKDITSSGLFVVLHTPIPSRDHTFKYPYYSFGTTLFLPHSSIVTPAISIEEANELSQYHIQCFHPIIGLIGWEKEEVFSWSLVSSMFEKKHKDWSFATYESLHIPKIKSISILAPNTEEEILNELEKEVEKKDLSTIPLDEEEKTSLKDKVAGKLGTPILKGILKLIQAFQGTSSITSSNTSGSFAETATTSSRSGSTSPGLFDKLQDWLKKNIEELEKQQQKELNRLLKMLDEDPSEALKYAIPLGGDELGRGQDMPSYRLTRNTTNFNMGTMSSGVSSYGWDVGNHYYELRQKYVQNAQKETENKNFRKAAYIYAHLLKDFNNAANVLEQGGFYKEAATLYLEKLNNKETAANCYEKGMHYKEAITIYKELKNHEKTGDLYGFLDNTELSKKHFQIASDTQLNKHNYLDAARIQKQKLTDTQASKDILLKGWKSIYNPEVCLSTYFSESYEEDQESLPFILDHIYKKHTTKGKESQLLNVLYKSPRRDFNIEEKSTDIAYKIISNNLLTGKSTDIHKLKNFVNDKTLESDINRFTSNTPRKKKIIAPIEFFLDNNITWTQGIHHKNQSLFLGHNETHWYIARTNAYKNVEYVTLKNAYDSTTRITLVNNPMYSDTILITSNSDTAKASENIILYKNKYFGDTLHLKSTTKFKEETSHTVHTDAYFTIQNNKEVYQLQKYNSDLDLVLTQDLKKEAPSDEDLNFRNNKVIYNGGYLYTFNDKHFYAIQEDTGKVCMIDLHTSIQDFDILLAKSILIKTYSGLTTLKFESSIFTTVTPYFSKDFYGIKAFFAGSTKVVHYSGKEVKVFSLEQEKAHLTRTFSIDGIICCLPVSRNEISILTSNGGIQIYEI